jgi:hypothetical protein
MGLKAHLGTELAPWILRAMPQKLESTAMP